MKRRGFSTWVQASLFATSILVLPLAMPTHAQVRDTTPTSDVKNVEGNYNRSYTGLWGLAGLLGLAGLAGRRSAPERPHTETQTRRSI